jgi:hypothetical protein
LSTSIEHKRSYSTGVRDSFNIDNTLQQAIREVE